MGGSRIKPSIKTPTADWKLLIQVTCQTVFSVPFDGVFRTKLVPLYLPSMELLKELQFMMEISQFS